MSKLGYVIRSVMIAIPIVVLGVLNIFTHPSWTDASPSAAVMVVTALDTLAITGVGIALVFGLIIAISKIWEWTGEL